MSNSVRNFQTCCHSMRCKKVWEKMVDKRWKGRRLFHVKGLAAVEENSSYASTVKMVHYSMGECNTILSAYTK